MDVLSGDKVILSPITKAMTPVEVISPGTKSMALGEVRGPGAKVMSPIPPATIDDDPPAPSCLVVSFDDDDRLDDKLDDEDGMTVEPLDTCVLTSTIKEVEDRARNDNFSDAFDSDVDLLSVMKKDRKDGAPREDADEGAESISTEEDDEELFTVHFAHTGRKTSPEMASQPELLTQISELQEAVVSMKGSLTEAVSRLSSVVEDPSMTRELAECRQRCDDNTAEVLKLVLSLKSDITSLQKDVASISDRQETLQSSVSQLLEERRLLVSDLSQAGVISLHTRSRLESRGAIPGDGALPGAGRSGSGTHSNDSGVALLLERAHQAFTADHTPSPTPTNQRASDQDSLPDQPSLLVPPSVYDYVAGLRTHGPHATSSHPATSETGNNRQSVTTPAVGADTEDLGLVYDSDSSLTIAANKTISLSASLSQQCGLELRTAHHTGSATHHHHHSGGSGELDHHHLHHHHHHHHQALRSDSDGSDQSAKHNRHRRRGSHERERESSDPYGIVMTRGRSLSDCRDPRESQRYRVARELLDTEKKYCKTLWTIQDTFAEPLKKAGILSHKDITTLFPEEVYQLYDKHCLLQHQLRERLASWKWQPLVGDVVARFTDPRHTDVLRLYTAYVNDFPEVLKTFHKLCRTSQPFTKFIKSCLEQPACGGLDLGAFLLTPVQRVPRYILLMKQLLKYTEPQHPDYQHLHACLERLRDFLARLNDSMEHSFQLVHAQLSPHGAAISGSSHHHPPPPQPPTSLHRPGRSPRRSSSSIGSPPISPGSPAYSPDRVSLGCSPHRSPESRRRSNSSTQCLATPQRSHSTATQPSCRPRSVFLDNRSSSLPRGSGSSSGDSRGSNAASPSSDGPRTRSRSESVASRRPLPSCHGHNSQSLVTQDGSRALAPALSVVDVTATSQGHDTRWEDLAASEPSLLDPRPAGDAPRTPNATSMSAAHSVLSVDSSQQKISTPVWTESSHSDDPRSKKKSSIRTSLKNMFTFKKSRVPRALHHHHHHHHSYHHHHLQPIRGGSRGRDDGEYWEAPPLVPDSSPSTTQSPTLTVVSVAQPTTLTVVPTSSQPTLTMVGDFVDEEGNPCSNV